MPCFIRSCTFVTLTNRIYVYVLQFHDSWGAVVQHRSMLLPTRLAAAAGHCWAAPHRNRRQLRQERVRVKVKVRRHGGLQALELLEAPLRPKHPQGLMRFQTLGAPRRPMHPQDLESQKHHSSPFEARGPGAPSVLEHRDQPRLAHRPPQRLGDSQWPDNGPMGERKPSGGSPLTFYSPSKCPNVRVGEEIERSCLAGCLLVTQIHV